MDLVPNNLTFSSTEAVLYLLRDLTPSVLTLYDIYRFFFVLDILTRTASYKISFHSVI